MKEKKNKGYITNEKMSKSSTWHINIFFPCVSGRLDGGSSVFLLSVIISIRLLN